jgi:hypothetical protein
VQHQGLSSMHTAKQHRDCFPHRTRAVTLGPSQRKKKVGSSRGGHWLLRDVVCLDQETGYTRNKNYD